MNHLKCKDNCDATMRLVLTESFFAIFTIPETILMTTLFTSATLFVPMIAPHTPLFPHWHNFRMCQRLRDHAECEGEN